MRALIWLLLLLTTPAFAQFSAVYRPPQTSQVAPIAEQLRERQTLEKLTAVLNKFVRVPSQVPVVAQSCGQTNAYYSPRQREIIICYELLQDHAVKLSRKYSQKFSEGRLSHVLAAELTFVLLHEVGHSLFDMYQIPVLGKEEDAADAFAAFLLLSTNGDSMLQEAPLFMPLSKTPWLTKTLMGAAVYGDEHALSEQRMANLVCWGFGKNPQGFNEAVSFIRLPQHRISRCTDEFAKMDRDVRGLLGDKLNIGGNQGATAGRPLSPAAQPTSVGLANNSSALLDQYQCNRCHAIDSRVIGPAYRDIANRYRGQDVVRALSNLVISGGQGNWGEVPAPPMRQLSNSDAERLVRWILSI